MIKYYKNDKILRNKLKMLELNYFLFKILFKTIFLFSFFKNNLFTIFNYNFIKIPIFTIINFCLISLNKKKFNKFSYYSRHFFLKKLQDGTITGLIKYSW
jgi:hypothetical protein